jgi:N6-L-threonylcarbamoyladenine synthase
MKILAIETSCDETSIAVLQIKEDGGFNILANIVSSQVAIHAPFGGVVPTLAKREHQRNLLPILKKALQESKLFKNPRSQAPISKQNPKSKIQTLKKILEREDILCKKLPPFLKKYSRPDIDLIAVTNGPGLEPALWAGVNFAKALAAAWDLPVFPVNHVEAHIIANWLSSTVIASESRVTGRAWQSRAITSVHGIASSPAAPRNDALSFPALALVVSGGHTQLILMRDFGDYKILGETRDDAAGEAFDKLAKMLNLGYPGGPVISHLAAKFNIQHPISKIQKNSKSQISKFKTEVKLPRPMMTSPDYDFSFSGLKTAALYFVKTLDKKTLKKLTPAICAEFQQAAIDVLVSKTIRAAKEFKAKTILLGGGVAANEELRKQLEKKIQKEIPNTKYHIPNTEFCADNAAMIALTALLKNRSLKLEKLNWQKITANSNLRLA